MYNHYLQCNDSYSIKHKHTLKSTAEKAGLQADVVSHYST